MNVRGIFLDSLYENDKPVSYKFFPRVSGNAVSINYDVMLNSSDTPNDYQMIRYAFMEGLDDDDTAPENKIQYSIKNNNGTIYPRKLEVLFGGVVIEEYEWDEYNIPHTNGSTLVINGSKTYTIGGVSRTFIRGRYERGFTTTGIKQLTFIYTFSLGTTSSSSTTSIVIPNSCVYFLGNADNIEVKPLAIQSIRVVNYPKVTYNVNEEVDLTSMTVFGDYNYYDKNTFAKSEEINGYTTNKDEIDITSSGTKTLNISYSGKTTSITLSYIDTIEYKNLTVAYHQQHYMLVKVMIYLK